MGVVAILVRKVLSISVCLFAILAFSAAAETSVLPLDEVRKGMKGYGLTVLEGTEVERFDVEIIGVLEKIGPGQDLILARVDDERINESGIIAGMSGSPIYVDGKIVGALAYAWQFAKQPVAGITPIEQMLRIGDRGTSVPGGGVPAGASESSAKNFLTMVLEKTPEEQWAAITAPLKSTRLAAASSGALPIATPVAFSGFEASTIERFSSSVGGDRLIPVASGSTGNSGVSDDVFAGFKGGDAFSALLVDGDFSLAANGTVTYVDGDEVYGFGHPFLDMGSIDLPMARSEVIGVLPSMARSFKFSNTGEVVGALRQDRLPGVLGVANAEASMVPVTVEVGTGDEKKIHSFRIARSTMLFPALLALTTDSIVASTQKAAGERTVVVDVDMNLKDVGAIHLRDGWAGVQARQAIPAYLGVVSQYLLSNEFQSAELESVNIRLLHDDELRLVRLTDATMVDHEDGVIRAGDDVTVRATLKPFRGEEFTETFDIRIPDELPAGRSFMFVGGGAFINRLEFMLVPAFPSSLEQVVDVIERLRPSTELALSLYTPSEGTVASGAYHPALPPSMKAVLDDDSSHSTKVPVKYHPSLHDSRPLDRIVDGLVRIEIVVRPKV